ncbi:hypothetical protein EVAR_49695_1 [Eumeta japonica]|uniref:Uncharacterized protein n=1 Tax=Eumeta variegata TaxID=151549 RepID=A0A4C1Z1B7_EUMVA|nr:hypothetical protein EVAR_49695_1 [Eumeta japonica]
MASVASDHDRDDHDDHVTEKAPPRPRVRLQSMHRYCTKRELLVHRSHDNYRAGRTTHEKKSSVNIVRVYTGRHRARRSDVYRTRPRGPSSGRKSTGPARRRRACGSVDYRTLSE